MTQDVLTLAERVWAGEGDLSALSSWLPPFELCEVGDRTAFAGSFSNVAAFATDAGLLLVDTGSSVHAQQLHEQVRRWNGDRLDTAVYSHGHVDHVFGVRYYEAEADANGWTAPTVVAHEALPARFDRYRLTQGYNGVINQRQFQLPAPTFPVDFRYPDRTYRDVDVLDVGGERVEVHHARGETDDHTWTWLPGRRTLCCGDLFIWVFPNAGNPQKVQRYPREWAQALREMAALGAETLLPGHGLPIVGTDRIRQAFEETAEALDALVDQTLALMNEGARLDRCLHEVRVPAHLADRPYLRPIYDEPEFVVRNVWRLYGGWYDGNPATLKPSPEAVLAREVADLAGGAHVLADRAASLVAQGDEQSLRLAGHLAELAALAAPDDVGVHQVRAQVFGVRARHERSTMSKGVFSWAHKESEQRAVE